MFGLIILRLGIQIVPQSDVFVTERLGKYSRTLNAGLSVIIPLGDGISAASNRLAIFLTGFVFCLTVKWMPIRALLSQLEELRLWGGE